MSENKTIDATDDFLKELDGDSFFENPRPSQNTKTEEIIETKVDVIDVISPISKEIIVADPQITTQNAKIEDDQEEPILIGDDFPSNYLKVVERIRVQYSFLPKLDYDSIYKEISELSIKSSPTPTLQVLNDELHKVQAAKDRLSEIFMDVIKCYNFKNRAVDILKDSWGKFTSEKNTEGRKGDATFRLSDFLSDFARVESLFKSCNHVFKNLDSLHDNLSRRITIWQMLMKLGDIGRGALPNYDFDKIADQRNDLELFGAEKTEEGGNTEVKLREF
jgi:hypothetical protein